jgi:predicted nucleotidyltransferase component of viral defense system
MLQRSTVEPSTFSILEQLMKAKGLESFYLVGGTCLSLLYGHRKSVDLDLFSTSDFNNEELVANLQTAKTNFIYRNIKNPIGLFGYVDEVKIDFVKHHLHPLIDQTQLIEGIRMLSVRDIIAMKIFAILKRAQKKDFWDLAELLQHYSLAECIAAYTAKYPSQQLLIAIPHAITYFTEAEESEEPISLKGQTWASVKHVIQQKVSEYLQ